MLTKEQRKQVMDLYRGGMIISHVAKKVGISRQSVYNIIRADLEKDADIYSLKKMIRKAELRKRIRELTPSRDESSYRGGSLERAIDSLSSKLFAVWHFHPNPEISERPQYCAYCGEEMEYGESKNERGERVPAYRCRRCDKVFPFP